ncbi:MAG: hypothetical protein P8Z00_22770 [Anaerolineales bacterium]
MELNTSDSSGAMEVKQLLQAPGENNQNLKNSIPNYASEKLSIDISKTITSTLYLPLMQKPASPPRPLGVTQLITGPVSCNNEQCYQIKVTCPNISQSIGATLMVGDPFISLQGTILFFTGWTGTYYWGSEDENEEIIEHLRQAGYRTVEIKWSTNWFEAELGVPEGMGKLACRPATVVRWVYDNLHNQNQTVPYCATGHSNGASQLGYAITQYDLADIFTAVVFESGPNWSRIDYECLHNDPAYQSLYGNQGQRNTIDWGFGFNSNGTGPCATMDTSFQQNFQESSLAVNNWSFKFPNLKIAFIFGGDDTTSTAAQGKYFHDLLINNGNSNVSMTVVPGAPHFTTETPEGFQNMQDTLLDECKLP